MRIAWNDSEAVDGFRMSKAEALSSFGDDTIFIEKFIEDPRHIEIQVLCDSHGNGIYLNERECTIQRRNQKVIEEAPSIFLDPETRKAMGEQALQLAKAVNYESAGTVEFLVDKHRNFYFLEMNTRLQVEHPVTEYITGVDLVEQMIRVAEGHPLTLKQEDIGIKGWAVESRVYAEDPLNNFLPSIGNLTRYVEPSSTDDSVRVDSGVREGGEISMYYDPLISKLVTYGPTREAAIEQMRLALDSYVIRGVTSNINFLRALMDHPRWISGDMTTKFIEEEFPTGFHGIPVTAVDKQLILAAAAMVAARFTSIQTSISNKMQNFDQTKFLNDKLGDVVVGLEGDHHSVGVRDYVKTSGSSLDTAVITLNGDTCQVSSTFRKGSLFFDVTVGSSKGTFQLIDAKDEHANMTLMYKGTQFHLTARTPRQQQLHSLMPVVDELDAGRYVASPMPGSIFSVAVKVGDQVVPGEELLIIEAMKMQNAIRATKGGTVKSINIKAGQTVESAQILLEIEPL